jgi:hypothetical protein
MRPLKGAATLFHIAIAVVAVSVVARRREFWYVATLGGVIGLCIFGKALTQAPPSLQEEPEQAIQSSHHKHAIDEVVPANK